MELTVVEIGADRVRAGYSCPCGCTPAVEYARDAGPVEDGCCCGNHFVVGPRAGASLTPKAGYTPEVQAFYAPWGAQLEAAWSIGPSVHAAVDEHAHDHEHDHGETAGESQAIDPVCGMTVEPEGARGKGLQSNYKGTDYFFCGKGCKLEFDDDPEHYLDPNHVPAM